MKHYQVTNGALTATGNSIAVETIECKSAAVYINVTAVSGGTPSLTAKLQTSFDQVNWFDLATGSAITATGKSSVVAAEPTYLIGNYVRVNYTISGSTPSFTLTVDLVAK